MQAGSARSRRRCARAPSGVSDEGADADTRNSDHRMAPVLPSALGRARRHRLEITGTVRPRSMPRQSLGEHCRSRRRRARLSAALFGMLTNLLSRTKFDPDRHCRSTSNLTLNRQLTTMARHDVECDG